MPPITRPVSIQSPWQQHPQGLLVERHPPQWSRAHALGITMNRPRSRFQRINAVILIVLMALTLLMAGWQYFHAEFAQAACLGIVFLILRTAPND
jgi:uncharacterized membrane protein YcjF (UPF0283 family)